MEGRAPMGALPGGAMDRVALDPRAALTSIGEVVYDWDIASDRITWGVNAADVLGIGDLAALGSGRELALVTEPGSGATRLPGRASERAPVDQRLALDHRRARLARHPRRAY